MSSTLPRKLWGLQSPPRGMFAISSNVMCGLNPQLPGVEELTFPKEERRGVRPRPQTRVEALKGRGCGGFLEQMENAPKKPGRPGLERGWRNEKVRDRRQTEDRRRFQFSPCLLHFNYLIYLQLINFPNANVF